MSKTPFNPVKAPAETTAERNERLLAEKASAERAERLRTETPAERSARLSAEKASGERAVDVPLPSETLEERNARLRAETPAGLNARLRAESAGGRSVRLAAETLEERNSRLSEEHRAQLPELLHPNPQTVLQLLDPENLPDELSEVTRPFHQRVRALEGAAQTPEVEGQIRAIFEEWQLTIHDTLYGTAAAAPTETPEERAERLRVEALDADK